jgi:hypothetical protein
MREVRFFDEFGTDVMRYASIFSQSPAGTNFAAIFDGNTSVGVDNTGDAYVVFAFPTRINFAKATYSSSIYETYCVTVPGSSTSLCPSPGWNYINAPARIYGSNDGTNFVQIGSVGQSGQTRDGAIPVVIPLTQQ